MYRAPDYEGPVGTMPESADKEDDYDIQVCTESSFSVSAERKINVLAQEPCKGDVPAFPEITYGNSLVW